jgi:DNA mismatch repair protein MutS2
MPGRSYGLDMATRLGIPDTVIQKARGRLGSSDLRLETLLEQVEEDAREAADLRRKLEAELIAARQEREETEKILNAARAEARDLKLQARSESHEVVKALRAKLRELAKTAASDRAEVKKAGAEVEALVGKLSADLFEERTIATGPARKLQAGATVRIARLNKTGTVLSAQGAVVELDVNGKKIRIPAAEVVPAEAPRSTPPATVSGWGAEVQEEEGSRDRLNLIGLRVPEGLAELDRFIDRAGLHHLGFVTIIHGLGSGAMKAAVGDFLKSHPLIASTRPGEPAEGGAGVTVAELKK